MKRFRAFAGTAQEEPQGCRTCRARAGYPVPGEAWIVRLRSRALDNESYSVVAQTRGTDIAGRKELKTGIVGLSAACRMCTGLFTGMVHLNS